MMSSSARGTGSFFSSFNNWVTGSPTGSNPTDRTKSFMDGWEEDKKVIVLKLDLSNDTEKAKALKIVSQISGVSSVALEGDKGISVIVSVTVDVLEVARKLRKHWSTELISIEQRKKPELKKESVNKQPNKEDQNMASHWSNRLISVEQRKKVEPRKERVGKQPKKKDQNMASGRESHGKDSLRGDSFTRTSPFRSVFTPTIPYPYAGTISNTHVTHAGTISNTHAGTRSFRSNSLTPTVPFPYTATSSFRGDSLTRTSFPIAASNFSSTTAASLTNRNNDWDSSCRFLNFGLRPVTLSECRAEDVNFLRGRGSSLTPTVLFPYTAAYNFTSTTAASLTNPNNDWNSFCRFLNFRLSECRGEDVVNFLRGRGSSSKTKTAIGRLSAACEARGIKRKDNPFRSLPVTAYLNEERAPETKVLFFSCTDKIDVEETSFKEAILKELYKREVTPLTYNLSGNLDSDMLYRSSVGIMVVSNSRFVRSSQYFDNLVTIMEHWKAKYLFIIPVYFEVALSGLCGLEKWFEEIQSSVSTYSVEKWKAGMTEIASIDGYQWKKGDQTMLAKKVVRKACLRLYCKNSKNLVRILALLNHPQPSGAEIEGIWGMVGIGKTSTAREVFEILAPQYDLCYFLQDFHLICQMKGLRQMRDDLLARLFGEEKPSIGACEIKTSFMRERFYNKTILIVLDDVSNARDAEYVVGGFGWFSHGHRIILTSRSKQVLVQCKVKKPYDILQLCESESLRLCKQYLDEENAVISELMSCGSGIPLALKVLASSISKQHPINMKEHLQSLRRNPPAKIREAFERSFNGLDENEKNILLDLACFFRGENKDDVVQILDACWFFTYLGICELVDESLISLLDNRIEIPTPFQDMCRYIVLEEDEDPCERSRLWDSDDVIDVFTKNSGTEAIEGILLDVTDLTCELSPTVFDEMYRLRLLKFYCSTYGNECKLSLPQGLDTLPDELRLLHWENYPLEYLPQKFNPENLVEINMPYSNMEKLWEGNKNLEKLKKIKLSHSRSLTDILILSGALNLEHIDLEGCTSLVDVSTSIPRCGKLVSLNMKDCSHLRSLPPMVDLTSLNLVNLSGCSELEEVQDFAANLKKLYLAGTAIRELPLSIANLTELVTLDLENCRRLQQLPFGISNLTSIVELKLSGCTSLESLPNLEALTCGT